MKIDFHEIRISDEKKQMENSILAERKSKEAELKEALNQQKILLAEKEVLIKNFSEIQNKLLALQQQQKQESKKENKYPPRPCQIQKQSILPSDKNKDDHFNPYKSSTPKNLSPRSISPVVNEQPGNNQKKLKMI